jgi:hypothetical protein
MMEEKRAHARIDDLTGRFLRLEETFSGHIKNHESLEKALQKNTEITQTIAENTTELVDIIKGAKGLRSFVIWVAPIFAAMAAVYAWIRTHP